MSYFSLMQASKEELLDRMKMYLTACYKTATVPTNKGFAKSIGYSDSRLRQVRLYKQETYQAELLEMFADICCGVVCEGALQDILNPKMAKFIANPHLTMRQRKAERNEER